jgi:hypothetical protein
VPDHPVFEWLAPASGTGHGNRQAHKYADCIGANIRPFRRAVAHSALADFYQNSESEQADGNSPVGSWPVLPREPERK